MRFFDELSYIKYKLGIGKILITIILIYILVIVSNSFLVHFTIKSISNDAALINSSGKIRGGIQRAVKLTLQDRYSNENILIIDKIFKDFSNSYEKSTSKDVMKDFYIKLKELEYSWSDLKILLSAYDKNKTFDLKEKILDKSEEAWALSMETLDTAQKLYDEKIGSFLSVFIIFTINLFFGFIIIYIVNKSIRLNLEVISTIDTLTNIGNRNRYNEAIEIYLNLFKKYNKNIAYIILDIDFFKSINDNFGHDKGDDVLIKSTKVILTNIKKDDLFCRIGGEEFVIVSENINTKDELEKFANKIRTSVENFDFELERKVTISLGATFIQKDDTKHSLFKRADEALYISKNSGRNRVTIL